jgi:hypothetical protein
MNRASGFYVVSTTLGESVNAFVPYALPPKNPALVASEFDLPAIVKVALIHAQFETIHPYQDGNLG